MRCILNIPHPRIILLLLLFLFIPTHANGFFTSDDILFTHKDFLIIETKWGDSFTSLAEKHLHDPSKAWIIKEFNNIDNISLGSKLVIPLQAYGLGGIKATGYQSVPILLYHRFGRKSTSDMVVTVENFEKQMAFLHKNGYNVITFDQLFDFMELKNSIPPKSVVLSFDDGWKTFDQFAVPILKKYGFSGTIFVYSDFIGGKLALSWARLKSLSRQGMDIQCQSKTHRYFNEPLQGENFYDYYYNVEQEILSPKTMLKERLDIDCKYLAYPYGVTNNLVIALLKKHHFKGAATSFHGENSISTNRYKLNRTMIHGQYDLNDFKKLLTVFKTKDLQ